jgi:hypothetical protein
MRPVFYGHATRGADTFFIGMGFCFSSLTIYGNILTLCAMLSALPVLRSPAGPDVGGCEKLVAIER